MDEAATIRRVQAGDTEAFRAVVVRYQRPLFALVRSYVRDAGRVEDLVQDALLKAFAGLGRFDPARGRLAPWLYAIARNVCRDALRRRSTEAGAMPDHLTAPARQSGGEELHTRLDRALADLPVERRTAFLLVVVHGMALEEAALIEDVPLGTIKSRVSRARSELRAVLRPEMERES